jgi:MoaA/NifB/PqqE/SkfB family radical SAM enzyme
MGPQNNGRGFYWRGFVSSAQKHYWILIAPVKIFIMSDNEFDAFFDSEGRLVLPKELTGEYGFVPGSEIRVKPSTNRLQLRPPVTRLAKVYIEPTNHCNLECCTCMRHSWNEPVESMNAATFDRIVEGLRSFSRPPGVFLGGLGEPLAHPDIVDMIRRVKSLGCYVELITNGTLLDNSMSDKLIDSGLDLLWVSLDGATTESYRDVRLGTALPEVLSNLAAFRSIRWKKHRPVGLDLLLQPQLGIVFVAMKRNIKDLPAVFRLASQLGATHFLVTNVLPYTTEMQEEILYTRALDDTIYASSPLLRVLDFPKMDVNPMTREALYEAMRGNHSLNISGGNLGERNNQCPFVEKGSLAIRWNGDVSPCLALLHDHTTYLHGYERAVRRHVIGNVMKKSVEEIWNQPDYVAFRRRLQEFSFSPCTSCGGCDYFKANEEDCIGSPFPACGGCLWA